MKTESSSTIYKSIRSAVMKRIAQHGRFTIPEISSDTEISMTTVGKYVSAMVAASEIEAVDTEKNDKRGRRAVIYGVKSRKHYLAAIDVKQYETAYGLMDMSGKLIAYEALDIPYENSSSRLEDVCKGLESFLGRHGANIPSDISYICMCLGGRVNCKTGESASKFALEELSDTCLADFLTERFGVRTIVENDTKAMAYGEYMSLRDKSLKNVLFLNVTWGLGLGIIIDGKLFYGRDGYSGEFGHSAVYDNDIFCHCGKKGCLETEVSGNAIHRKLIEKIKSGETSRLSPKYYRGEAISLADIIEATAKEDPLCIELITKTATELGRQVSTLINIFNPEAIILGGDLAGCASYYFMYPMRVSIMKYSLKLMTQDIKFITSELAEKSGAFGACMIARNRYLTDLGENDL